MLFQRYRAEKYTFNKQSLRLGKLNPGLLLLFKYLEEVGIDEVEKILLLILLLIERF